MKILFICNQGKHRSKTASELFKDKHETNYVGIYSEDRPLTKELLNWAELIVVMEELHRKFIAENYPKEYLQKKIICLDIPDIYSFGQKELVKTLKMKSKKINTK